jgi:hypothetical protein
MLGQSNRFFFMGSLEVSEGILFYFDPTSMPVANPIIGMSKRNWCNHGGWVTPAKFLRRGKVGLAVALFCCFQAQ